MRLWAVEHGTLWVLEPGDGLPPRCAARAPAAFEELGSADVAALAVAMGLSDPEPLKQRLAGGRRCFSLRLGGQIAAYGWVTRGVEHVGELERQFNLRDDEVYIWDCGTLPAWRGRRCYSALLSHMAHRLAGEGAARIWIGASLQNQPSVRGFANAGFRPVVELTYRRLYRLTGMWMRHAPSARRTLVAAAYRILLNRHERQIGRLVIGYRP